MKRSPWSLRSRLLALEAQMDEVNHRLGLGPYLRVATAGPGEPGDGLFDLLDDDLNAVGQGCNGLRQSGDVVARMASQRVFSENGPDGNEPFFDFINGHARKVCCMSIDSARDPLCGRGPQVICPFRISDQGSAS